MTKWVAEREGDYDMDPVLILEREIEGIEREAEEGIISQNEAARQIADVERDYCEVAREAAEDAYQREMECR